MVELRDVTVAALNPWRLRPLIGERRYDSLQETAEAFRIWMGGTTIWNVNSTAFGGGVAEMLQVLVGYSRGLDLDVRWVVLQGDAAFFTITKRLHNRIHGVRGDVGDLGNTETAHYEQVTQANADALLRRVRRGDVAILHDPQSAGLAPTLSRAGVHVIWRCHIGSEKQNGWSEEAWQFLYGYIDAADAVVFSRAAFAPPGLEGKKVAVIPPSIDPFSPKNRELSAEDRNRILHRIGVFGSGSSEAVMYTRSDGTPGRITRSAVVAESAPLDPSVPLIVQVSRWDRLKDMVGVMRGFAAGIADEVDAELALVGPSVDGVTDDPEGGEVLGECTSVWKALPDRIRRRIRLITLPMVDGEENAIMVNALQAHAAVIVQKSLAEGFGLTVAEGMWKAKPVVASAVGGIVDQIVPGTGILLDDPADLDGFAGAVDGLLRCPDQVRQLGQAARHHVLDHYVGDLHLLRYAELIQNLVAGRDAGVTRPGPP